MNMIRYRWVVLALLVFGVVGCEPPNEAKIAPGKVAADAPKTPEEAAKQTLNMKVPDSGRKSPYVAPPPPPPGK